MVKMKGGCGYTDNDIFTGHAKVLELLLDYGASTALPDSSGNTLLQAPNYPGVQLRLDLHRRTITDR